MWEDNSTTLFIADEAKQRSELSIPHIFNLNYDRPSPLQLKEGGHFKYIGPEMASLALGRVFLQIK